MLPLACRIVALSMVGRTIDQCMWVRIAIKRRDFPDARSRQFQRLLCERNGAPRDTATQVVVGKTS